MSVCYFNQLPQGYSKPSPSSWLQIELPFHFTEDSGNSQAQPAAAPTLSTGIGVSCSQHIYPARFPTNQEHVQTQGKIKYNLPQEKMKGNPNRNTSKGFLFATFIPCAEGTIVSKRFALLNETGTREAFLGKIILKNHQKPIPALQTPVLNKEM